MLDKATSFVLFCFFLEAVSPDHQRLGPKPREMFYFCKCSDLSCRVWCGIPPTRRAAARLLLAINVNQFVSLLANDKLQKNLASRPL